MAAEPASLTVRTIHAVEGRCEAARFDLTPNSEEGEAVCGLFREFLRNRPPEFRDRLAFLNRGNFELEWAAAGGGAAMATLLESGDVLAAAILLSGASSTADASMIDAYRQSILEPMFGPVAAAGFAEGAAERPLLLQVHLPGSPEWAPVVQLLMTALASVYFRAVEQARQHQR